MRSVVVAAIMVWGIPAVHGTQLCSPEIYAVCQMPAQNTPRPYRYWEYNQLTTNEKQKGCVLCADGSCTVGESPGIRCYSGTGTCALCGNPDPSILQNRIGNDYTIYPTPTCSANHNCTLTNGTSSIVYLDHNITFSNVENLTIGYDNTTTLVVAECPLFVFSNVGSVTVKNLVIVCNSNRFNDVAPALYFFNSLKSEISVTNVVAKNHVKSAVLIDGTDTGAVPPILEVDLSGSVFAQIEVTASIYRSVAEVSLGNVYGENINMQGLLPADRVIVQPVRNPTTDIAQPFLQNPNLGVINISRYTGDFTNSDYQLEFENKDENGYSSVEDGLFEKQLLKTGLIILAIGTALFAVRYQATIVIYMYPNTIDAKIDSFLPSKTQS